MLGRANSAAPRFWIASAFKDFARVAQLSAEEAFRLLQNKHDREQQNAWSRFETELAKRTAEIRERHKDELRLAIVRKGQTSLAVSRTRLREVGELRERNQAIGREMSKVARCRQAGRDGLRGGSADVGRNLRQREAAEATAISFWHIATPNGDST